MAFFILSRLLFSSIFEALLAMPRLLLMGIVVAVMIGGMLVLVAAAGVLARLSSR